MVLYLYSSPAFERSFVIKQWNLWINKDFNFASILFLYFLIHLTYFYILFLCSQVAIDEMQNKVKELNHVISLEPPDMKKLQLKLAGSVSVQVTFSLISNQSLFLITRTSVTSSNSSSCRIFWDFDILSK